MKPVDRKVLAGVLTAASLCLVALAATAADAAGPSINAGPQAGTVWLRGSQTAAGHAAHTQSPNLIYHGGPVMTSQTEVFPIFWGTSWPSYVGDKISGINGFYSNVGATSYLGTNSEYNDSTNKFVSTAVHENTVKIDGSAAVSRAPQTSDILAEVARMYPHPTANAYYPVYIDQPRGHAGYCAWHSSGTINGTTVQFGFFFKLDGDAGCDPRQPDFSERSLAALGQRQRPRVERDADRPAVECLVRQQGRRELGQVRLDVRVDACQPEGRATGRSRATGAITPTTRTRATRTRARGSCAVASTARTRSASLGRAIALPKLAQIPRSGAALYPRFAGSERTVCPCRAYLLE